jgi:hypothetical protein
MLTTPWRMMLATGAWRTSSEWVEGSIMAPKVAGRMARDNRMRPRTPRGELRTLAAGAAALAVLAIAYSRLLRAPILTWGATEDEAARTLPGDDLLADPDIVATRAISIPAPASAVWPWLVQMGPGRGGAYTYDWIEQRLGIDIHSADRIVPELQQVGLGDVMQLKPGSPGMRVEVLVPEHAIGWRAEDGSWVWTFVLIEQGATTRLISRNRIRVGRSLGARLGMLVMEPGSLVMERKMLRGIRERAGRPPAPVP